MVDRVVGTWVGLLAIAVVPGAVTAQPTPGSADAVHPGSVVVHVSPIAADTLPILCRDMNHPERGFVTETDDPEWTPRLALALERPSGTPDQAAVLLELEGTNYAASFPAGASGEGFYTAVATVTASDGSAPPRMISFTANCSERLPRGG